MDEITAGALITMRNDVSNLQKDVARQELLVTRFDNALDKMSEVSMNVSRLLAVHEQRLVSQGANINNIIESSEKRIEKYDVIITGLDKKVGDSEHELRKEMSDGQKEILSEIKTMRVEMSDLGDELKTKTDTVKTELEKDFSTKIDLVSVRVTSLERWSWVVMGGAAVIGFLLSQALNVFQLFH